MKDLKPAKKRRMLAAWADMEEIGDQLRAGFRSSWTLTRRLDGLEAAARQLLRARDLPTRAAWYGIHWDTGEWKVLQDGEPEAGLLKTILPPSHFDARDTSSVYKHEYNVAGHLYRLLLDVERVRAAWQAGDFERAEADASGLFAYVARYGDQLAEHDLWAGRKSREQARSGATEAKRSPKAEERAKRNESWREGFAAQTVLGREAWAAGAARRAGVSKWTVLEVLKGRRG